MRKLEWSTKEKYIQAKTVLVGDCWLWQSSKIYGYGQAWWDGKKYRAHRFVYEALRRPLQPDEILRHTCDTKDCCNPDHLLPGTPLQNSGDMVVRGRSLVGERNPISKLTERDVAAIRASKETQTGLGKRYGVSQATIWKILRGQSWKHSL